MCDRGAESHSSTATQQVQDESAFSAAASVPHSQPGGGESLRAHAPSAASGLDSCHFCAKSQLHVADRLKRCDRCRSVAYCSVQCQRGDWSAHKKGCPKTAKQSE
jgi:hypothetical protein